MKILFLLFALVSCGGASNSSSSNPQDPVFEENREAAGILNESEKSMILLVNSHRESKGLSKLKLHTNAIIHAQDHSIYMSDTLRRLTHNGYDRRMSDIRSQEDRFIPKTAENVAYNSSVEGAHNGLINSRGHRKNIEGDYTHFGVGQRTDSRGRMYFTQIFLKINN